ncbi:succinylarginine dihydrolase [Saccharobesus litoralis]|uniref:N-succinylarginine dihydrolase n=1 Tax=Saccharobesus litoralis TaxID=2172099 RepID=A0A2S0VL74_9ALTE|nr:N-succinylarginine dihydrolase [Saccharobesus litoralis]AWB64958.1 succinylarginine dihydrolase [Saccharobesus litoralis]
MKYYEVNFDGLVGPTHNYAGLAYGNLASQVNANSKANPKRAALQGLDKMQTMLDLGLKQGYIPPLERPDIRTLEKLGFFGTETQIIQQASKHAPQILAACFSASNMWVANAATISSSLDTQDHKIHITPANLLSQFHRSIETQGTAQQLKEIFPENQCFVHHAPLPAHDLFADEGAANHMRMAPSHSHAGINIFVYGRSSSTSIKPQKYPARHTLEACQAIARCHLLNEDRTVFIQQNPTAIDAGAFHNDVVAVNNENVIFYHEHAFLNTLDAEQEIKEKWQCLTNKELYLIKVTNSEIDLTTAIKTYIFNSQIVTIDDDSMVLIAPIECQENTQVKNYIEKLISQKNPINRVIYQDLRQSMKNGGGPACLRLRVVLNSEEIEKVNKDYLFTQPRLKLRDKFKI